MPNAGCAPHGLSHRPDADLWAAAPASGPGRVRRALQPPSPAPGQEAATTGQRRPPHGSGHRSDGGKNTTAESPRPADQRVRTGSMTVASYAGTLQVKGRYKIVEPYRLVLLAAAG